MRYIVLLVSSLALSSPALALPDLIVTSVHYDQVTHKFSSTIKNQGTSATPKVTIGVSYSVDNVKQTWGWALPDPNILAAGASENVDNQGPLFVIPAGTHMITAFVDDVNRIAESNENNNKLTISITIGGTMGCLGTPNPALGTGVFDPNYPPKLGYNLVFDSEFNDFNDFDLSCEASAPSDSACTNPPGKNWYLNTWTFPNHSTAAKDLNISNGVLAISQVTNKTGNWAITTRAGGNANGPIFSHGAYFEIRIASEARNTAGQLVPLPVASGAHSSFWIYDWKHKIGATHFAEVDMPDGEQDGSSTGKYQFNDIDWTQGVGTTLPGIGLNSFHQVDLAKYGFTSPQFVDRNSMHVIGTLWVPATSTTHGFLQSYFDGKKTGGYTWPQGGLGSILDSGLMQVILGNDPPSGTLPRITMYADWVHVWQLPSSAMASGNSMANITPQANFTGAGGSCHP